MKTAPRLAPRFLVAATAAVVATNVALVAPAKAAQEPSVEDRVQNSLTQAGVSPVATSAPGATVASETAITVDHDLPSALLSADGMALSIELLAASPTETESTGLGQFYGDVAPDTDTVVQPTEAGVQFLHVLHSPAAPAVQRYRLDLPRESELNSVDGGYVILDAAGEIVGAIEAPWAMDAAGRTLPTSYELEGAVLVQRTNATGAEYPIVVDPKLTFGRGVYLNVWGTEVRAYATAIAAVIGAGIAISCTLIGKLPHQVLRTLATLICGAAAISLRSVFEKIYYYWRNNPIDLNACYQTRIFPTPATDLKKVSSGNCT